MLAGAVVAFAALWLGANFYPYSAPALRWTEADLPGMPAAPNNDGDAITSEPLDVEIPDSLHDLLRAREPADRAWARLEREAELLRTFLRGDRAREVIRRIDVARRRPAFASPCPLGGRCGLFEWHAAHDVAVLHALSLTLDGRSVDALELLRDLVKMDVARLASASTLIGLLVAQDHLGAVLDKLDVLVAHTGSAPLPAGLAGLALELRGLDVDLDLRPIVIGEYLSRVEILDALDGSGPEPPAMPTLSGPRRLHSRALTLRELDERFARRHTAAAAGDIAGALGGGETPATRPIGWWLLNPIGKQVIDAGALDPESLASDIRTQREFIARTRARLLARLSGEAPC